MIEHKHCFDMETRAKTAPGPFLPSEEISNFHVYSRDFLVYLAGPIAGLTYGEGQDWRDYVSAILPQEIRAISPLRAKAQRLARAGVIKDSYEDNPLTSTVGITTRDRFDCTRADAVIFNLLGAKSVSIGTCMEFGWADATRRPIILAMEESGNLHDHPMIRGVAGFRVTSLEAAVDVAEAILLPEGKGTPRYGSRYLRKSNVSRIDCGPAGVTVINGSPVTLKG